MGKFVSASNRTAPPIFPKMPGAEQRMRTEQKVKNDVKKPEQKAPEKASVNVKPTSNNMRSEPAVTKKRMSADDLRQGFKMSVILGEPVCRKYRYGRKIQK